MSITEYFTQLCILWNELKVLRPIPAPIVNYSYGGLQLMRQFENSDQVTRILRGLDDFFFSGVQSQIMLLKPLPEINQVFSLIFQ